ncbi:MAG: hypothetical protein HQ517_02400 [SAR324 cluster bacterium]|nr:hypothetical protein [SAR324 cluster bacterium]
MTKTGVNEQTHINSVKIFHPDIMEFCVFNYDETVKSQGIVTPALNERDSKRRIGVQ